MNILKRLFCRHNDKEVICWHWTHGESTMEVRFLEIQMRCRDCGKYHFTTIRDWEKCDEFISRYRDNQSQSPIFYK